MYRLLPALILIPLLSLIPCINSSRGADDPDNSGEISCPDSCENSRKNCDLSCSQIMGGGVENEKKRECLNACGNEVIECNKGCVNPTPCPTLRPEAYHDKSCTGACEYKNKDCAEECTKYTGGGAASVKKLACLKDCGVELDKCNNFCANPNAVPTFNPEVYENNPCEGPCGEKRKECEVSCGMFSEEGSGGGKRGECLGGCKEAEYNCLDSCPR